MLRLRAVIQIEAHPAHRPVVVLVGPVRKCNARAARRISSLLHPKAKTLDPLSLQTPPSCRRLPAYGWIAAQIEALPRQGPRGAPPPETQRVQAGLRAPRGARRRRQGRRGLGRRGQRGEELRRVRGGGQPEPARRARPRHAAARPERVAASARRRRRASARPGVRAHRHRQRPRERR